jgi:hypothetical protein
VQLFSDDDELRVRSSPKQLESGRLSARLENEVPTKILDKMERSEPACRPAQDEISSAEDLPSKRGADIERADLGGNLQAPQLTSLDSKPAKAKRQRLQQRQRSDDGDVPEYVQHFQANASELDSITDATVPTHVRPPWHSEAMRGSAATTPAAVQPKPKPKIRKRLLHASPNPLRKKNVATGRPQAKLLIEQPDTTDLEDAELHSELAKFRCVCANCFITMRIQRDYDAIIIQ